MLLALTEVDYGVLVLYLLGMVAIGFYFSREQHTSADFFLAGRSMGWFPVGLSIMATLLSALSYTGVPGEAYYEGHKHLLFMVVIWLTLPIMFWVILPLYRGLGMFSVYEYLEMRFGPATRMCSSIVFIVWRLLWLGGVLYAPCKVLIVAAGLEIPEWVLLLALGLVSTIYTFLGGMKAVIWTDVIQTVVMVGGVVLIAFGVWAHLDNGPRDVWEISSRLGRTEWVGTEFDWSRRWSVWGMAPHVLLSMLSFYIADQITVQRYLTTRDLREARRSFVLNCISVCVMIPALMYVGMSLMAFYQQNPQHMRPIWVANVDNLKNRVAIADAQTGAPLLDWKTDGALMDKGRVTAEYVDSIVAGQKLLRPNSKEPFADSAGLLDSASGELVVDKLAMRNPRGEWILNRKAQDEFMPRFITDQLPLGVAGLILAALFAASMSSMDSGLNSICTLAITDLHRRMGFGRDYLARKLGKSVDQLGEADELELGRPLVLLIGLLATLFSLIVGQMGSIFDIMVGVVNTFGGPLMAIFLLGMLTRRTTAAAALSSLVVGTLYTIWVMAVNKYQVFADAQGMVTATNTIGLAFNAAATWLAVLYAARLAAVALKLGKLESRIIAGALGVPALVGLAVLWIKLPSPTRLNSIWPLFFGVAFTLVVGYVLSFVIGERKSNEQLRGLVLGVGQLGRREPEEASIAIVEPPVEPPPADPPPPDRWK